jgi:hypothetical protein
MYCRRSGQAATLAASGALHIQAVLTWWYLDVRCPRAPSLLWRKMFSMLVRYRYQWSAAAAVAGVDTSRLVRMNE